MARAQYSRRGRCAAREACQSVVIDFFPEYADLRTPENSRITFQHLLTMSHGLLWNESKPWDDPANNERGLLEARDPYRYVMERPMTLPPGACFNYCGGATSLRCSRQRGSARGSMLTRPRNCSDL